MMYWQDGSWGWGAWVVMALSMLAFWSLLVFLVVSVIRRPDRGDERERSDPTPEDVLARRFASGDIEADDYRARSEILREERGRAA